MFVGLPILFGQYCYHMDDNFKCNMCVFLLDELEKYKSQLFDQSIQAFNLKAIGTQTCNGSSEKACQTETIGNVSDDGDTSCELTLSTNSKAATSSLLLLEHSTFLDDNAISTSSSTVMQDDISETSVEEQAAEQSVYLNERVIDSPYHFIPGKPFADFDVEKLANEVQFTRVGNREVKYFGKNVYSYGSTVHQPCEIVEGTSVSEIFTRVNTIFNDHPFNSVLVTKYSDGNSSIPMHSDDESELAENSIILTVSLGACRFVNFQHKGSGSPVSTLKVEHGDVYIMSSNSQELYKHGIPKDFGKTMRISLTFRHINEPEEIKLIDNGPDEPNKSLDLVTDFLLNLGGQSQTSSTTVDSITKIDVEEGEPSNIDVLPNKDVDTLFVSSSMFRHINQNKLSSKEHNVKVLFFPGQTAGGILKNLKTDPEFATLNPCNIKQIFLLCGTNDVDTIMEIPRHLNNSIDVNWDNYNQMTYGRTKSNIEHLIKFLNTWAVGAKINMINILPRTNYCRNIVINDLNNFIKSLCKSTPYLNYVNTELDRYLFATRTGLRRNELFLERGTDNVHLNSAGVIKLGKLLKYLLHH